MIKYNYATHIYILLKIKCHINVTEYFFLYHQNTLLKAL